jgi:hypothetical protein
MSHSSLQLLQAQLQTVLGKRKMEYYSFSLFERGIPRSAVVEISGTAKISFLCRFLSEHLDLEVLWLRDRFLDYPPALEQMGAQLKRITFVQTENFQFESIRLATRSKTTPFIIAPAIFDEDRLKKLKFMVEESRSVLFLLSYSLSSTYAITAQIQADHSEDPEKLLVHTHKYKCEGLPCE